MSSGYSPLAIGAAVVFAGVTALTFAKDVLGWFPDEEEVERRERQREREEAEEERSKQRRMVQLQLAWKQRQQQQQQQQQRQQQQQHQRRMEDEAAERQRAAAAAAEAIRKQRQRQAAAAAAAEAELLRRKQEQIKQQQQQQQQQQQSAQRNSRRRRKKQRETQQEGYPNTRRPPTPEPPVDTAGRWVPTEDFPFRKSFGWYLCDCGKHWVSAHAVKDKWQQCKECNAKAFPELMWINDAPYERHRNSDDDSDEGSAPDRLNKPHDQGRCQVCQERGEPCWWTHARGDGHRKQTTPAYYY